MVVFRILIFFILLFFSVKINFANDFFEMRDIYRGSVSMIDIDNDVIWISSNQFFNFKTGSLLYVHEPLGKTKVIVRILEKKPHFIKAEVIDGDIESVEVGNPVNNVYTWDGFQYLVELVYEHESSHISIYDKMVIDNELEVVSLFGKRREYIFGSSVEEIKFENQNGMLNPVEIELGDGRGMKINDVKIDLLDNLKKKTIKLSFPSNKTNSGNKSNVVLDSRHLTLLRVIRPLKGIKKIRALNYDLSDNIDIYSSGENRIYNVTFRFFNVGLAFKALERLIEKEKNKDKVGKLISLIKSYDIKNIEGVSVVGSFNSWDSSKNFMNINDDNIYEATISLDKGDYSYYFVIHYNNDGEKIEFKVLDPYLNTYEDEYEYIFEKDYINRYLRQDGNIVSLQDINNFPGSEENAKKQDNIRFLGDSHDFPSGVNGKFSFIEIPGFSYLEKNNLDITDEEVKIVKHDKLVDKKKKLDFSSVFVNNLPYYKVRFIFNQFDSVKNKLQIMMDLEKDMQDPDKDKINNISNILNNFDKSLIKKISVIGTFNNWNKDSHSLEKSLNTGLWQGEHYIPSGKYEYQFSLFLQFENNPIINISLNDENASNKLENSKSVLILNNINKEKVLVDTKDEK